MANTFAHTYNGVPSVQEHVTLSRTSSSKTWTIEVLSTGEYHWMGMVSIRKNGVPHLVVDRTYPVRGSIILDEVRETWDKLPTYVKAGVVEAIDMARVIDSKRV